MEYISDQQAEEMDTLYEEYYVPSLASRGARLGAFLIDQFISYVFVLVGFILWWSGNDFQMFSLDDLLADAEFHVFTGVPMLLVGVIQAVLLTKRGQSLGKIVLDVRIVRYPNGERSPFANIVLVRTFLVFLIKQTPLIGIVFFFIDSFMIFREDRRCLHDLMASTMVINAGK